MNAEQRLITPEIESNFSTLLKRETLLLSDLETLMANEKEAVETNQIEQLIPIAEDKQQLLDKIEKASVQRQQFLMQNSVGQTGLDRLNWLIDGSANKIILRQAFDDMQNKLKECQDLNNTNAKIIAMSQRHVERNLNIIKGVDNSSVVYNSQGNTQTSSVRLNGVKA